MLAYYDKISQCIGITSGLRKCFLQHSLSLCELPAVHFRRCKTIQQERGGAVLVQAVGVGSWGRNAIGNCHADLACSLVHGPRTHVCMLAGSLYRS